MSPPCRGQEARSVPLDPATIEAQEADVLDRVATSMGAAAAREALRSLPPEQRESVELAYFEGLTHLEIAEAMGVPLGTVKSRLRLGLERMRSSFGIERKT